LPSKILEKFGACIERTAVQFSNQQLKLALAKSTDFQVMC